MISTASQLRLAYDITSDIPPTKKSQLPLYSSSSKTVLSQLSTWTNLVTATGLPVPTCGHSGTPLDHTPFLNPSRGALIKHVSVSNSKTRIQFHWPRPPFFPCSSPQSISSLFAGPTLLYLSPTWPLQIPPRSDCSSSGNQERVGLNLSHSQLALLGSPLADLILFFYFYIYSFF